MRPSWRRRRHPQSPKIWIVALGLILVAAPPLVRAHHFGGGASSDPAPDSNLVEDPDCGDGAPPTGEGKPVSPFSGKEFIREVDLSVPGVFPIEMARRYDSSTRYQSELGAGWAFTYDWHVFEYPDGSVIVRNACGMRHRYVQTGNAFTTSDTPGFRYDLRVTPEGSYILSDRPGTLRTFDADGKLTAIQSPQGNRLEFIYDPRGKLPLIGTSQLSVDPSTPLVVARKDRLIQIRERTADGALTGRFVDLTYEESSGRLQSIEAHDGRAVRYEHELVGVDGVPKSTGNLTKVVGLEGIEHTYAYDSPHGVHLVTSMQRGQATTPVVNVYDEQARVVTQVHGDTVLTFEYAPTTADFDFAGDAADCDTLACRIVKRTIVKAGEPDRIATTAYKYGADGYPVEKIDALGHRWVFGYEPSRPYQNQVQVFRNLGSAASPSRELQKTVARAYDLQGNSTQMEVELDSGEVITRSWTYEDNWMSSSQVVSSADPGKVFRTEWTFERAGIAPDEPGFDPTSPISNVHTMRRLRDEGTYDETRFDYNSNGQLARVTPPAVIPDDGLEMIWTYTTAADDGLVGMLKETHLEVSDAPIPTLAEQYTYDARSFRASMTDALGVRTLYELDDLGRMVAMTEEVDAPEPGSTSRLQTKQYTYRGPTAGLPDPSSGPPGDYLTQIEWGPDGGTAHAMRRLHDGRGRLVRMERRSDAGAFELWWQMQYDSDDNAVGTEDAIGRTRTFGYDVLKRVTRMVDGSGNETLYDYDAVGNRTRMIDAKDRTTRMEFDDLDRLITVIQEAESLVTRMAYDAANNQISIEDPKSQVTAYTYDARSRLRAVTQPLGVATPEDPNDFVVRYEYDDRDRLIRWINARGHALAHTYASWGGVYGASGLERIDHYPTVADAEAGTSLQRSVRYTYDVRADVHATSDTEQLTLVPAGPDPAFEPAGRLYTFAYDGLGRASEAIAHFVPGGAPGEGRTLTSSYDLFENRTGLELAGPAELLPHTWTFDALDRPVGACLPQDQPCAPGLSTLQIAYRPNDDLDLWTHGNGTTTSYTYEPQGRLDAITVTDPAGGVPLELVHDYDPTLNLASIREIQNDQELTGPGGTTPARIFGYDGIDRLTSATYPTGVGLPERDDYAYDPAGNRDEASPQGTPLGTSTYDASNRIQASPSNRTYAFDPDGNQTEIADAGTPIASLTFDFTNRLRRYDDLQTSSTTRHFYDPFGRRIRKVADGVTTWYVWDGDRLLAEYDGSGARAVRYAYAGGFAPAEVAFAAPAGGESIHSVHSDHLDTPRLLTDSTATESWRASYRAYGAATVDADPDGDGQVLPYFNVRLPGQYFDAETDLHYNGFRYYDPAVGRYINQDPIGMLGGLNLYAYGESNPENAIDPFGLAALDPLGGVRGWPPEKCAKLLRTIQQLERRIQKRLQDLRDNPWELPETCPGDDVLPSLSREGHRRLIREDRALLALRLAEYRAYCTGRRIRLPEMSPELKGALKGAGAAALFVVVAIATLPLRLLID